VHSNPLKQGSALVKWIFMVLAAVTQAHSEEAKSPIDFKNKVTAGLDGHFRYERTLAYGFHIGTDGHESKNPESGSDPAIHPHTRLMRKYPR
jgi:hypothetical protein